MMSDDRIDGAERRHEASVRRWSRNFLCAANLCNAGAQDNLVYPPVENSRSPHLKQGRSVRGPRPDSMAKKFQPRSRYFLLLAERR